MTEAQAAARRIYPRPPIVEAVIEVRFQSELTGAAVADAIEPVVSAAYPAARHRQERVHVTASVEPESLSASARRLPHVIFLRSADGRRLLGCGPGSLSVHVLAPYPGWESFIEQACEAVAALPAGLREQGFDAVAIRYIDRVALPSDDVSFADLFTFAPRRPRSMPAALSGFHVAMQTIDPADQTVATLTLATEPLVEGQPAAAMYDLHLIRPGAPTLSAEPDGWLAALDRMHGLQRTIFEESITERARRLFE